MTVLGKTWKYINEGNVHIVIGIQGENIDSNYVIRLIKENGKSVQLQDIRISMDFVNLVMIPLVTIAPYGHLNIQEIPADELKELTRELAKFRPKERMLKTKLSCYAIKTNNLAILNPKAVNYCVEIKPKEGFMSSIFKKYGKCYYCLKQFLKLQEKQILNISKYCPLDLFSGNKSRMKRALLHLSESPQNNFKVFHNGEIIFSETNKDQFQEIIQNISIFKSIDEFFDFIVDTLLYTKCEQPSDYCFESASLMEKTGSCEEKTFLHAQSILYKILGTQKLCKELDFMTTKLSLDSLEYVSSILDQLDSKTNLFTHTDRRKFLKTVKAEHLALISAVAKDCSIMISFSTYCDENPNFISIGEDKIPFRVSVTDLEPKYPKTLVKRKETEKKLIELYDKYLAEMKGCPHSETRAKQLEAWQQLIAEYLKTTKQSTIDIRESQNTPLFNNQSINRKLSQESILVVLDHMAKAGQAAPLDKSKNVWEVYWHSLDEWGNMVYNWACSNGMNNSVCTLFELREGENTVNEEFHGLEMTVLLKALKSLEVKGKCELMEFDDNQGVKFF